MAEEMSNAWQEQNGWQVPDAWGRPEKREERSINWGEVKRRIAEIGSTLGGLEATSPDTIASVWARRAERLALALDDEGDDARVDLLMVRLGVEVFAFEAVHITSIRPMEALTPVPRVPAWVAGVANVSGRILSVIDLRAFLSLPGSSSEAAFLVIAESKNMEIGFVVDEVLSVTSLPQSDLQEGGQASRGLPSEYIHSLAQWGGTVSSSDDTTKFVVVLDLEAVLEDERLIIHEEI
jgi:purine-binding chemotaxis protein CheW